MIPKFRTWDKENNEMLSASKMWNIGLFISGYGDIWHIDDVHGIFEDVSDRYILMQYTSLKDKNGVEVYFNDIVEDEYGHRYEVVFEGDCLRCNGLRRIRGGHKPKNRWFGIDLKIIGNRYENPELLKEQNK